MLFTKLFDNPLFFFHVIYMIRSSNVREIYTQKHCKFLQNRFHVIDMFFKSYVY